MELDRFKEQLASDQKDFCEICLAGANLQGLSLRDVKFSGSCLKYAKLDGADLSGAVFYRTYLSEAALINTNLREAKFANLEREHLHNLDLSGADLTNAKLTSCDFSGTKLDGVILENIYIERCTLPTTINPIQNNQQSASPNQKTALEDISKVVVNNQAILFSPEQPIYIWDNLRYRSKAETEVAKALEQAALLSAQQGHYLAFWPNNLGRFSNPNNPGCRFNREADFMILYKKKFGILEVDGKYHQTEWRAKEMERERIFKLHGISVVERFDANRCYNEPNEVVKEFLQILDT